MAAAVVTPIVTVSSTHAPKAIGPYSHAIKAGETVYLSGQIPLDPNSMMLVSSDFKAQANQVFTNIQWVAEDMGSKLNQIAKLTIYLTDIANMPVLNEVMMQYFNAPYPARTTIQVSALPKLAQIEIDAILIL
ncbi:MAG: YjgF-like protein [uncultured bacterium]|nr:MAG: YjgF-like protein [uncultured bacterium]